MTGWEQQEVYPHLTLAFLVMPSVSTHITPFLCRLPHLPQLTGAFCDPSVHSLDSSSVGLRSAQIGHFPVPTWGRLTWMSQGCRCGSPQPWWRSGCPESSSVSSHHSPSRDGGELMSARGRIMSPGPSLLVVVKTSHLYCKGHVFQPLVGELRSLHAVREVAEKGKIAKARCVHRVPVSTNPASMNVTFHDRGPNRRA